MGTNGVIGKGRYRVHLTGFLSKLVVQVDSAVCYWVHQILHPPVLVTYEHRQATQMPVTVRNRLT